MKLQSASIVFAHICCHCRQHVAFKDRWQTKYTEFLWNRLSYTNIMNGNTTRQYILRQKCNQMFV